MKKKEIDSTLNVFTQVNGQFLLAGKLTLNGGADDFSASFVYDSDYLRLGQENKVFALDPINVPLRDEVFYTTSRYHVLGAIFDAAPDAWGRFVIASNKNIAPSSTKNKSGKRDPEMRQTKKGNNWHFGMKAHIGVDAESGLVHTITTTSANEHDITQTHALSHGEETVVFGDAGYTGVEKREELQDVDVTWHIAMKPGLQKAIKGKRIQNTVARIETLKASGRAKVEHPFRVIKRQFGFTKVRYKGLAKNTAQVFMLFALSNLWMARNKLMELTG